MKNSRAMSSLLLLLFFPPLLSRPAPRACGRPTNSPNLPVSSSLASVRYRICHSPSSSRESASSAPLESRNCFALAATIRRRRSHHRGSRRSPSPQKDKKTIIRRLRLRQPPTSLGVRPWYLTVLPRSVSLANSSASRTPTAATITSTNHYHLHPFLLLEHHPIRNHHLLHRPDRRSAQTHTLTSLFFLLESRASHGRSLRHHFRRRETLLRLSDRRSPKSPPPELRTSARPAFCSDGRRMCPVSASSLQLSFPLISHSLSLSSLRA